MSTMIGKGSLALVALFLVSPCLAGERELDAHQHGHGTVNLAIEGSTLWIELEAPGMDIVGFEHPSDSAEDKASVADAMARLEDPLRLFQLTAEADCSVESATVRSVGTEGHDDHAHETDHDEEDEERHSEYHAEYRIVCQRPELIDEVSFTFFDIFPGAEELVVNAITAAGQNRYEITRDAPVLWPKGN